MSRAREEKKRRGLKNPFRRKPKQQPAAAQAYAPSGPYYDDDGYSERDGYDDDGYDDYASTPRGGAPPASLEELVARITTNSEEQTGLGWPQRLRRFLALFDLPPEPGGDAEDACADIEAVCRFAMMPEALGMSSADLSAILLDIADDLEMPDEGETVALADVLYTILVHPPDWGDWVSDRFVQLAETLQTIGELFEGSLGEALQPHERPAMFASVDSILVLLDALDLQEAEAHLAIKDMLLPLDAHVGASGYGVPPGMSHGISLARLLHWLADFFAAPRAATFHGEAFGSADAAASEEAEAWEVAAVLAGLGPGRDAEARDLFQSLRPDSSDWARVFEQPYASTLARVDARMWQGGQYQLAVPSFGRARPLPLLWSATRAELRRESARLRAREPTRAQLSGLPPQPSAAVSHFPPQWLALAPIVKKGVRVHCFKYAPPAQFFLEDGVVYDGLVKVGGQWRLFLRPWHHVALLPTCAEMEQAAAASLIGAASRGRLERLKQPARVPFLAAPGPAASGQPSPRSPRRVPSSRERERERERARAGADDGLSSVSHTPRSFDDGSSMRGSSARSSVRGGGAAGANGAAEPPLPPLAASALLDGAFERYIGGNKGTRRTKPKKLPPSAPRSPRDSDSVLGTPRSARGGGGGGRDGGEEEGGVQLADGSPRLVSPASSARGSQRAHASGRAGYDRRAAKGIAEDEIDLVVVPRDGGGGSAVRHYGYSPALTAAPPQQHGSSSARGKRAPNGSSLTKGGGGGGLAPLRSPRGGDGRTLGNELSGNSGANGVGARRFSEQEQRSALIMQKHARGRLARKAVAQRRDGTAADAPSRGGGGARGASKMSTAGGAARGQSARSEGRGSEDDIGEPSPSPRVRRGEAVDAAAVTAATRIQSAVRDRSSRSSSRQPSRHASRGPTQPPSRRPSSMHVGARAAGGARGGGGDRRVGRRVPSALLAWADGGPALSPRGGAGGGDGARYWQIFVHTGAHKDCNLDAPLTLELRDADAAQRAADGAGAPTGIVFVSTKVRFRPSSYQAFMFERSMGPAAPLSEVVVSHASARALFLDRVVVRDELRGLIYLFGGEGSVWLDKRRADGLTTRTLPLLVAFEHGDDDAATCIAAYFRAHAARKLVRRRLHLRTIGTDAQGDLGSAPQPKQGGLGSSRSHGGGGASGLVAGWERTPLRSRAGTANGAGGRLTEPAGVALGQGPRGSPVGPADRGAMALARSAMAGKKYRALYDEHIDTLRDELALLDTAIQLEELERASYAESAHPARGRLWY